MKKVVLLALATVALFGVASAQEVTYVEDCSQGLLANRNADNWFITVEGGANVWLNKDSHLADFKDRIGPQASLYVGKWVSPVFGFRFGANWVMPKGATTQFTGTDGDLRGTWVKQNANIHTNADGTDYAPTKFMGLGPEFDVLINLTNWWCGYKPNRVYNAVLHGGAGAHWTLYRGYKLQDDGSNNLEWRSAHNTRLIANVGLQQNFRCSSVVELFLDLQFTLMNENRAEGLPSAALGITFNLPKNTWSCPVTAVCPTWKYTDAEGDALVARLQGAENKIRDLQRQLDECLNRPMPQAVVKDCEGLATIYYPINQSAISSREKNILRGVADVMKNNPDKVYTLTGWADNYTGTDEINARLRQARVDGVKNFLLSCGVPESQLEATTDSNNLTDFGAKSAALDRAVTIDVK